MSYWGLKSPQKQELSGDNRAWPCESLPLMVTKKIDVYVGP